MIIPTDLRRNKYYVIIYQNWIRYTNLSTLCKMNEFSMNFHLASSWFNAHKSDQTYLCMYKIFCVLGCLCWAWFQWCCSSFSTSESSPPSTVARAATRIRTTPPFFFLLWSFSFFATHRGMRFTNKN